MFSTNLVRMVMNSIQSVRAKLPSAFSEYASGVRMQNRLSRDNFLINKVFKCKNESFKHKGSFFYILRYYQHGISAFYC